MCWGCANHVPRVGVPDGKPLDPLGACWECGVFGCLGHAERDVRSAKWHCHSTVATALGASAGLVDPSAVMLSFAGSHEFEERFPRIAEATMEARAYWRSGEGEGRLAELRRRRGGDLGTDWGLMTDAVGVAMFLVRDDDGGLRNLREEERTVVVVLPATLAALVKELRS